MRARWVASIGEAIDPRPMRRAIAIVMLSGACGGSPSASQDPAVARQEPTEHEETARAEPEPQREAPPDPAPQASDEHAGRPALQVLRGRASYYSDRLAGRHTANGDVYDPRAFTAASRDLPFGTIVRVVREDTGASVIVRVNDRGPHRDHSRILDLSRAAAERLDMIRAGVIDIRAEIVERP